MDFGTQYLTYAEYVELGGTLDETPFNILEFYVRNEIDLRTQNRIVGQQEIPLKVKMCVFHLIEKVNEYSNEAENTYNKNIASENIDGYSISYVSPSQIKDIIVSKRTELDDIMLSDLFGLIIDGTAVLYNGVK